MPVDQSDPAENAKSIVREIAKYGEELSTKDCWLVLNKTDLLPADDVEEISQKIIDALDWKGPVSKISAISKVGTDELVAQIMEHFEALSRQKAEEAEQAAAEKAVAEKVAAEESEKVAAEENKKEAE